MVAMPDRQRMTVEEYFAFDEASELKWEYLDGMVFEVYAMAGASPNHVRITNNAAFLLNSQLRDKGCEVFSSDLRVKLNAKTYAYPDVVVVCGKPEFGGHKDETLLNPTMIVEVLSPSTENYDRGGKAMHYRSLASLQEIVIISQDHPHIEVQTRQADGAWLLREMRHYNGSIELQSIGGVLALSEVYRNVEFPDAPTQPD